MRDERDRFRYELDRLPGSAGETQCRRRGVFLLRDSEWAAPRLWRSEFRNILATYIRQKLLTFDDAVSIYSRAEALVGINEYDAPTSAVLRLAKASGCSAYNGEFVALAQHLEVRLISADTKLCKAFPDCPVVSLRKYTLNGNIRVVMPQVVL